MTIKPLRTDLRKYLYSRHLIKKWEKASDLFNRDVSHPSLNTELMEPRWRGIYSFRIDIKYRALFFIDGNLAEVFKITNHYKK